jgi:hypothetical protein
MHILQLVFLAADAHYSQHHNVVLMLFDHVITPSFFVVVVNYTVSLRL